jgi:hypothetical protein
MDFAAGMVDKEVLLYTPKELMVVTSFEISQCVSSPVVTTTVVELVTTLRSSSETEAGVVAKSIPTSSEILS